MRFDVLTLHPEMVRACLHTSILGRAIERGRIGVGVHDIRDHATDRHRTVDDTPCGGGAGMVLKVDVLARALAAVRDEGSWVVLTSPAGRVLDQDRVRSLATLPHLVVVCGHYEGVDARFEALVDEQLSLGDFVLTGGEIAAAAIVDATARLVPGVLGNEASAHDESFSDGLLEYPQYTRPREWDGAAVPEVLFSGHHGRITAWRRGAAMARTRALRPDLWARWCAGQGLDPTAPIPGVDVAPRRR